MTEEELKKLIEKYEQLASDARDNADQEEDEIGYGVFLGKWKAYLIVIHDLKLMLK